MTAIFSKNNATLLSFFVLSALAYLNPSIAQNIDRQAKTRATNLARNTAISLNGGLARYVPDSCMFDSSQPVGTCLRVHDLNGFIYSFLGGEPGWQQLGMIPNTETVLQISPTGKEVLSIIYNGSPRSNFQ